MRSALQRSSRFLALMATFAVALATVVSFAPTANANCRFHSCGNNTSSTSSTTTSSTTSSTSTSSTSTSTSSTTTSTTVPGGSASTMNPTPALPAAPTGPVVTVPTSIAANCSTDVTQALDNWFATVPNNVTIQFPANGCYNIEGTLYLPNRTQLDIEGNGSQFVAHTDGTYGYHPTGTIDDSNWNQWPQQRSQFIVELGSDITIRNVIVHSANSNAGPTYGAFNLSYGNQDAFLIEGTARVVLDHDQAYSAYGDFIETYGGPLTSNNTRVPANAVTVTNGTFNGAGRNGVSVTDAENVLVENNTITGEGRWGIDIEPPVAADPCEYITIYNNNFGPAYGGTFSNAPGATATIKNIDVNTNQVHTQAMLVYVVAPSGDTFQGYNVSNNTSDTQDDNFYDGMVILQGVSNATVTGNNQPFTAVPSWETLAATHVTGSSNISVTKNSFVNASTAATIDSASSNVTVSSNTL